MRIRSLDGLRGLAATIVMIHHALLAVPALAEPYVAGGRAEDAIAGALLYTPLHFFWEGRAAVYVFFILSGLVLTLPVIRAGNSFSWAAYYPSRLLRLYLPVWTAVVLGIAWLIAVPRDSQPQSLWLQGRAWELDAGSVVRDLTLVAGHGGIVSPLWSLRWEILFSVLLPAFVFVGVRFARYWWVLIVLSVAVIAASDFLPLPGLAFLPMFMIGVALAVVLPRIVQSGNKLGLLPGWGLVLFAMTAMVFPWLAQLLTDVSVSEGPLIAIATLGALSSVYCAVAFAPIQALLESRVLQWLGLISFSLYLVHEPVVISVAYIFGDQMLPLAIAVGLSVSLGIGYLFFRVVEVPTHRLSRYVAKSVRHRLDRRNAAPAEHAASATPWSQAAPEE